MVFFSFNGTAKRDLGDTDFEDIMGMGGKPVKYTYQQLIDHIKETIPEILLKNKPEQSVNSFDARVSLAKHSKAGSHASNDSKKIGKSIHMETRLVKKRLRDYS